MQTHYGNILKNMAAGTLGGAMLAALGDVISSTSMGVIGCMVCCGGIGWMSGRIAAALVGILFGVLLSALGAVLSGSVLGVAFSIVGCGALAAGITWGQGMSNDSVEEASPAPASSIIEQEQCSVTHSILLEG